MSASTLNLRRKSARVEIDKLRHRAKFNGDRWNRSRDMAIFRLLQLADVLHLGFVMCVFGPPTEGIWWSLSLNKIWLESMQ